jgi:hypothetical protein
MPLLTCTDSTGSGWTAGSLPELSSTCTRFRRSISAVCRSFESAPGRIRTSDSRFRNAPPQLLCRPGVLANSACLQGFRRFWCFRFPTQFGSVLARLQYGCSKQPRRKHGPFHCELYSCRYFLSAGGRARTDTVLSHHRFMSPSLCVPACPTTLENPAYGGLQCSLAISQQQCGALTTTAAAQAFINPRFA